MLKLAVFCPPQNRPNLLEAAYFFHKQAQISRQNLFQKYHKQKSVSNSKRKK
jgi:hypothetical protein